MDMFELCRFSRFRHSRMKRRFLILPHLLRRGQYLQRCFLFQLGSAWDDLQPGWNVLPLGMVANIVECTDSLLDPYPPWNSRFWPFRSCFASMNGRDWKVVRWNEKWGEVENPAEIYTQVPRKLLTVVYEHQLFFCGQYTSVALRNSKFLFGLRQ